MKTLICLVRHGETNWNQQHLIQGRIDIDLNENGVNQIHHTALRLKQTKVIWDVYLSSPLQRAISSCKIIRNCLNDENKPIIIRPNLIEREFGEYDGHIINDDVYAKILNDDVIGMEKSSEIQERAKEELVKIVKAYRGKNVLIVTHSHFIKALFTTLDHNLTFKSTLLNGGLNFIVFNDDEIESFDFNQ
ncbi:MAG: histidine phosphatase family protein [Bacilli bacterium]